MEIESSPGIIEHYESNVSGLVRRIRGVGHPRTTVEVQSLVREANAGGFALYPFSTGANWGLGSKLPVKDGALLVDLSRMRAIRSFDERHGVAVIEPGVTQRDLHERLIGTDFFLSVTGSGEHTSILGNSLDRGISYYGPRAAMVAGLEVVLGSGEIVRTGLDRFPGARAAHLYPYGVGPGVEGLFFQSSFGIVTAAGFRCRRRRDLFGVLRADLDDDVGTIVDRLDLPPAWHLANRHRTRSVTGRATHAWSLACALSHGDQFSRARSVFPHSRLESASGHAAGLPSDEALPSLARALGVEYRGNDLDAGRVGTLFSLPVLPKDGAAAREAVAIVESRIETPYITLNAAGEEAIEMVINVVFDRASPGPAHEAMAGLDEALLQAGFPPCRVGIRAMDALTSGGDPYWELVERLKTALDPNGVIAPGRYCVHRR